MLKKILAGEALSQPARVYINPQELEDHQLKALSQALKETLKWVPLVDR
ncbi:hypothetical protein [Candidatus Hecatella orcuttiae]|nr:hypothetical protein [Candidatus Hecatella orcuttiae]